MVGMISYNNEEEKSQLTSQPPQPRVVWSIDSDLTTLHLERLNDIKEDLSRRLPQNEQQLEHPHLQYDLLLHRGQDWIMDTHSWWHQPQEEEWNRQSEDNNEEGVHREYLEDWQLHQNEQQHRQ